MARIDGRENNQLREVKIIPNYIPHAEGSVLISLGKTKVICTASIEEKVPPFLVGKGKGWITAEYAMLPRATDRRSMRESQLGRPGGRTQEIQRLIGRSLRSVADLESLPELTIYLDADVITADGGTRTAAITGCFVALYQAMEHLMKKQVIEKPIIQQFLAATSVGVVKGQPMLDLNFKEDCSADVDMNVVMTEDSNFIELQATGEKTQFSKDELDELTSLADLGIKELIKKQKEALGIADQQA
ncbi:MAG: ribonuclease PH [Actinobacteria bacterium]|nr:MAG: ribonuclease PH [Actinomycetota bacterium]